ncbi:hypothetical protein WNY37_00950 [Henriciella sp. AS95]|uniref:hypothetical protein n=1 Tax=Henriciella sp. AS95 TaxID=3135782 RepID=UPI00316DE9D4
MKLVKGFAVLVVALGVVAIAAWQFWLKDQVAFGEVATAYGAKVVCSCRFVAEREMASCKNDFTEDVSAVTFKETGNSIMASAAAGLVSATATFEPGLGCTLVDAD